MSDKPRPNYEKQIGDAVRSTVESGDLSHLKSIGGAVQGAVQDALSTTEPSPQKKSSTTTKAPSSQQKNMEQKNKTETWLKNKPTKQPAPKHIIFRSRYGVGSTVAGVLGLLGFGFGLAIFTAVALIASMPTSVFLAAAIPLLLFTTSSIGLFASGLSNRGFMKRLRQYTPLLKEKPVWTIEALCTATNFSPARIRRDFRKAIGKKIISDVQMDAAETCVIYGAENYKLYLASECARQERELAQAERQRLLDNPETAPIERFRCEGEAILQEIRAVNNAVEDEIFSGKLDRLELITSRIFSYVNAHPEKLPDTRKFMDYYLPTTLKLVTKYRQYEEENLQMDNILQAKTDIISSLDTIDLAFNNLLESLYHEDTLDIVTDIDVLQTVLKQEGLTDKKFEISLD